MKKYIKPPFLSTSFSESGKRAKKRFVNILNTKVKRAGTVTAALALCAVLAAGALVACEKEEDKPAEKAQTAVLATDDGLYPDMDGAIAAALLEGEDKYADAEFWAEGHIVLAAENYEFSAATGTVKNNVYMLTSVGGYSFINGVFVKESGTGVIPAVAKISTEKDGPDGETYYKLEDIKYPEDGSNYLPSMEAMFPEKLRERALNTDESYAELLAQEHSQAEAYLKSIGREAKVGAYADLDLQFPDMSPEEYEKLEDMKKNNDEVNRFPDFIGTREYVEDGERFVYETAWDSAAKTLVFTKYGPDSEAVSSRITVNVDSGAVSASAQYADGQ